MILAIQSLKTRGSDDRNLDNGRILTKTRRDLILVISAISAAGGMGRMEAPPLPSQEGESLSRFLRFQTSLQHRRKHSRASQLLAAVIPAIKSFITRHSQGKNVDQERILTKTRRNLISVISAISAASGRRGAKDPDIKEHG